MRRMGRALALALLALAGLNGLPASAQAGGDSCPPDAGIEQHFAAGEWGRVTSGETHNLRQEPGLAGQRTGQVPADDIFRVREGPLCRDNTIWWRVRYDGTTGWVAEGPVDGGQDWLAPLVERTDPVPSAPAAEGSEVCQRPPESYARIRIGYGTLNLRTLAMLDLAQALYSDGGGIIRLRRAIMQGSYNPGGVSASFGTHDGGGAVDLSVRDPATGDILASEVPALIQALREAGFAAWLRETGELYPGSPIHIHAIAIADAELSEAARAQIDGPMGYLRGFDGLPREDGIPRPDRSGEMVVCDWMRELGFDDLRTGPASAP